MTSPAGLCAAEPAALPQPGYEVARSLTVLAPLIKEEIEAGNAAGVEHYRRAGEMLIEAKAQCQHGEWKDWIARNFSKQCGLSYSTAKNYMKLAEKAAEQKDSALPFSSIREAVNPAPSGKTEQEFARVEERCAQTRRENEAKNKLKMEMANQVNAAGFLAMAVKLHPDKPSGSTEAMALLNEVRRFLRRLVREQLQ